jgi:hypothetical protein
MCRKPEALTRRLNIRVPICRGLTKSMSQWPQFQKKPSPITIATSKKPRISMLERKKELGLGTKLLAQSVPHISSLIEKLLHEFRQSRCLTNSLWPWEESIYCA